MGVWDRFTRLIKSNVNSMISKAENPEKTLNQLITDMNGQLIEAKKAVATSIADEKRLERQLQGYLDEKRKWEERAMLAVKSGQSDPSRMQEYDNLARESLQQVKNLEPVVHEAQLNYDRQHAQVESLKNTLRELQQKIEEAQRKKNILISRARRAEAQQKIQEQISGISNTSAFQAFEDLEKKVDEMEIRADTLNTMSTIGQAPDSLEEKFKALERGSGASVDSDLERLKNQARLNLGTGNANQPNQQNQNFNQGFNQSNPPQQNISQQSTQMDPDLERMMNELKNKSKEQ